MEKINELITRTEVGPIAQKILKKIFARPCMIDELTVRLGLNDFTLNRYLRVLILNGWIEKDNQNYYKVRDNQKEKILKLIQNKLNNRYTIHKILTDAVDIATQEKNSYVLNFQELELSPLNLKILEAKIAELQDYISKLKMVDGQKNGHSQNCKTIYTFCGIISDDALHEHIQAMYQH